MGKRFTQTARSIHCYTCLALLFNILSHLFSTRRSSYDVTRNGRYYRVSGAYR